jgi:prepilin-type N-terminal cleavage/methylation domain-containing protein
MDVVRGLLQRVRRMQQSRSAVCRARHLDDRGMTLTELLLASTLLLVLLTVVMLTMSMFDSVTTAVNTQYQEFDQALPALAPLQQLLRAQVEPGPTSYPFPATGQTVLSPPTPPFKSIGNYSLVFYANIGMADGNVATEQSCTSSTPPVCVPTSPPISISAGPAKIMAGLFQSNGAVVTSNNQCSTSNPCTFQVRERLPIVSDDGGASTCPIANPSATACAYPPATSYKLITNALDVTNTTPVFSYMLSDPCFYQGTYDPTCQLGGTTFNLLASDLQNTPQTLSNLSGYPAGTQSTLGTCVLPTPGVAPSPTIAVSCPLDAIQRVTIDLQISVKGSGLSPSATNQGSVENQSIVYRDPIDSGGTTDYPYPFQYTNQLDAG